MTPDQKRTAVMEVLTTMAKPLTVKEILELVDGSFFREGLSHDAKQTAINDTLYGLMNRGNVVRASIPSSRAFLYHLPSYKTEPAQQATVVATPSKLPDSLSIDGTTYFAESLVSKMVQEKKDKGHVAKLRRIGSTRTMSGEFSALEFDTFDNDLRPGQMLRIIVEN